MCEWPHYAASLQSYYDMLSVQLAQAVRMLRWK